MTSIGIKLVASTEPVAVSGKLRLGSLTALVIGSMIGSGVFSLPQNMAAGAGPLAIAIGWGSRRSACWRWSLCINPWPPANQT